ncbi:MAG: periplasmic heavy metal sensor [Alphaproteobacteria bacterium]|nr:periplasmic heavy metal sensor [Alphaproteobacteria bacterium]
MTDLDSSATPTGRRRWSWPRRILLGSGLALAAAGGAFALGHGKACAHGPGFGHGFGHGRGFAADPESAREWAGLMARQVLRRVNATAEQTAKVESIVGGAIGELYPLRQKLHAARDEGLKILTQPSVDRAALEKLRAEQLAMHEAASRRMVQALADVAETLTPEQRVALARELEEMRPHRRR